MRKLLQTIAWFTHTLNWEVNLFNFYLNGEYNKFGFQILYINNGIKWSGSLLEITGSLPTVTHLGNLRVDVLFLYEKWDDWCINMTDRVLWGSKLNSWEKINYYLHTKFKSIG